MARKTTGAPGSVAAMPAHSSGGGFFVNVVATARSLVIVTVQSPAPLQAPLQPAKVESSAGAAESETLAP